MIAFFFFFFNPTIEVVTVCLHGWCMLGVFLLPAFTCLGHECQDLLSAMACMCAQTRPWFILSSERVFRGMESEPMSTPWEKSPLPEAQRSIELTTLHHAGR